MFLQDQQHRQCSFLGSSTRKIREPVVILDLRQNVSAVLGSKRRAHVTLPGSPKCTTGRPLLTDVNESDWEPTREGDVLSYYDEAVAASVWP